MTVTVFGDAFGLTHRRLTAPACPRALSRTRRAGRADRREVAFARSGRCTGGRRDHAGVVPQLASGVRPLVGQIDVGGDSSRDPLDGVDGTPDVANPYAYVSNDPLNQVDPLGLRKQDPDFDPDLPDPTPPDPEPGCQTYQEHRTEDYLRDRLDPPCGFARVMNYTPERLMGSEAGEPLRVNADTGGCSQEFFTDAALMFLPPGPFGVPLNLGPEARSSFHDACAAHDYGYDLLRFAQRELEIKSVFQDRTAIDAVFNDLMSAVCGHAGWIGVWNKGTCQWSRGVMYVAVRSWTSLERSPK